MTALSIAGKLAPTLHHLDGSLNTSVYYYVRH